VFLSWIRSHPSRWKTFVANRVTTIQANLPASNWNHVPGKDNPADLCSRGTTAEELINCKLWWVGPDWMNTPELFYSLPNSCSIPSVSADEETFLEERKVEAVVNTVQTDSTSNSFQTELLSRWSNLNQLLRITALLLRFKFNCNHSRLQRISTPITPAELDSALKLWIAATQQMHFSTEIEMLKQKKELFGKCKILSLNPFVDSEGLLRVGGRLRNANIPQDQKTPFLIPRHSKLTDLLIRRYHLDHNHAGPSLLLAVISQRFWILRARDAVKFAVKKCVVCMRQAATTQKQFMGNLPVSRVTPCRAFIRCGVDYAGPFLIKPDIKRCKTTIKAYLSLFVCFATRAFHLEVVSSLTTEAFIAALRRFVSRRGKPTDIHSDCGTNFVGANKELKEMLALVQSSGHNTKIANSISTDGISWHFNPPGAPHFGGLWEAGVKSVKFHLNRIIGSTRLTFEELTTVMCQVEACLNSRPLTPLSSDPSDLIVLTSGHFLIGEPLLAVPDPDLSTLKQNRLSRWQLIQTFQQQFWKRCSSEYLARLQQRPKWLRHRENLQDGDLVIIKDDNLPPQKWRLGRVIRLHPGDDDIVRVATLRTAEGELQRPITKLCLLPIQHEEVSNSESV